MSKTKRNLLEILAGMLLIALGLLIGATNGHAQSLAITKLGVFDAVKPSGEPTSDASIDTVQGTCGEGDSQKPEPFFDTYLAITIANRASSSLRLDRVSFTIPRLSGRRAYRSPRLGFIGALEVPPDSEKIVYAPILSQRNGRKRFQGVRVDSSSVIGFRTVSVLVTGTVAQRQVQLPATLTLSFGDFDRCE